MTDIDALAQVLCDYDVENPEGQPFTDIDADWYRGMARAAVDALQLTEDWRCLGFMPGSEEMARRQSDYLGGGLESRLVGPWVGCEEDG